MTKDRFIKAIHGEIKKCTARAKSDEPWKQPFWRAARACLEAMLSDVEGEDEERVVRVVAGRKPWKVMTDLAERQVPGVRFGKAVILLAEAFARRNEARTARESQPLPDNVVEFRMRKAS